LPKEVTPIIGTFLLSFSAPANISEAEALPLLIKTTRGTEAKFDGPFDTNSVFSPFLSCSLRINCPFS